MMISPELYIEEKKNRTLVDLYKEKERLEKYLYAYNNGNLLEQSDWVMTNPSPSIIASFYEKYLVKLNKLISEKENTSEIKYIQYNTYEDIKKLIEREDDFSMSEVIGIDYQDRKAEITVLHDNVNYIFSFKGIKDFKMKIYTGAQLCFGITLEREADNFIMDVDMAWLNIKAKEIIVKTIDIENTVFSYASIKYKENQDKTFYYISNIENLKIGDYVWVSVRDEEAPGIVENIEKFSYENVPFPVNITKTIIRKSTKQEYERFHRKKEEEETMY